MHISPLTCANIPAAKRVIATVVLEFYFIGRFTTDELLGYYTKTGYLKDLDQIDEIYDVQRGLLLGAFDGETLVGTGGVREIDHQTGELVRLWLLKEYRGRGAGRQLSDKLLHFARNAGWKRLRLDTSLHCVDAVKLFRRLGFREIPAYKESLGDCFMELDLTLEAKQAIELDKRLADHQAHPDDTIPWDEIKAATEAKYGQP